MDARPLVNALISLTVVINVVMFLQTQLAEYRSISLVNPYLLVKESLEALALRTPSVEAPEIWELSFLRLVGRKRYYASRCMCRDIGKDRDHISFDYSRN
jgi:hypothetical protein